MCLVVFAHDSGDHVLAVAANRDENYERQSLPLHAWPDAPGMWGGRDALAGGTWLGVSARGRLSAVTNVRRVGASRGRISRGALCREFLTSDEAALSYSIAVLGHRADYAAFNLLVFDGRSLCYVNQAMVAPVVVPRGIHAVSNAALNDPWPKVERARRALGEALDVARADLVDAMFALLANRDGVDDDLLPDTGYGVGVERDLASIFVATEGFGTRCSTVVLWHRDGLVTFEERSFGPGGTPGAVVRKELTVSAEGTRRSGCS